MFSQVCVKNSVHRRGMHGGGGLAWQGACMAGGMCGRGMHGRRACMAGACMAVGMCGRGMCVWQGGMHGREHAWSGGAWQGHVWWEESMCARGVYMAGETATAVDGTHPTGLYSCLHFVITMFVDF